MSGHALTPVDEVCRVRPMRPYTQFKCQFESGQADRLRKEAIPPACSLMVKALVSRTRII